MKNVLIICPHRVDRSPSQRYRYEQYISFLSQNGYRFDFSILLNEKDDRAFYSKSSLFRKGWIYLKTIWIRLGDWVRANRYDIIFIQREALMTGTVFFEKRFARSKAKMIFDFDDAIWLQNISDANRRFAFLKNPSKTGAIIRMADLVFAGNRYLADYASRFNSNISIIPTTIDTDHYTTARKDNDSGVVCIGWTGSFSTIQHFAKAIPALQKIKMKYGDKVRFSIIGDASYYCSELETPGVAWVAATEVKDLSDLDIGIMPLPDDEWSKGKCGLKGLQYMALGIPTLMSPVGVNTEIIQHGVNGFLPATEEEWVAILSSLLEDASLRKKIGEAGRQTVVDNYSVNAWKGKYLEHFNRLTEQPGNKK